MIHTTTKTKSSWTPWDAVTLASPAPQPTQIRDAEIAARAAVLRRLGTIMGTCAMCDSLRGPRSTEDIVGDLRAEADFLRSRDRSGLAGAYEAAASDLVSAMAADEASELKASNAFLHEWAQWQVSAQVLADAWAAKTRAWVKAQVRSPKLRAAWIAQGRPWEWTLVGGVRPEPGESGRVVMFPTVTTITVEG